MAEHVAHEIELANRTLCLTGEFFFGSRRQCSDVSEACGARVAKSVSGRVDYLVLGAVGSEHWVTTSFGRKIEKAMNLRAEHGRPMLVLEDVWRAAVAD